MPGSRTIGFGCMRLSTDASRDEARAIEVIHAALDSGATLLDTARAYGHDDGDLGHNERLVAQALRAWKGDRSRVVVATKGGMARPSGKWVPSGRATQVTASCEASLAALGAERIDLYLLHAPDPRVPLETSVRALASLQRAGLVRDVGLCNVNVSQIERARSIVEIAAVQVKLGPFDELAFDGQVASYCADNEIALIAHSPFGGLRGRARFERDATLARIAARHGATPFEIGLAWLLDLHPRFVPIPGATRVVTARSSGAALRIELSDEDRAELDARFSSAASFRRARAGGSASSPGVVPTCAEGEVVVVMGIPGAGKTSAVRDWVERGYERLNRDATGGKLAGLAAALDRALGAGGRRFVLDNTYPTRATRRQVVEVAARHGVPVRCVWLTTSLEDAQVNACERLIARYAELPRPERLAELSRADPNAFPPNAQFRWRRELEPPDPAEGFASIEQRAFERVRDPSATGRAIVIEIDGVVRRSRCGDRSPLSPADVDVMADRAVVLRRHVAEGSKLLGLSWQPAVSEGVIDEATVAACIGRMNELLGLEIDVAWCPHGAGPPVCWCRKPLPGLGVVFVRRHGLDPSRCIHVGKGPQDRGFAGRLGFEYADHEAFFASG